MKILLFLAFLIPNFNAINNAPQIEKNLTSLHLSELSAEEILNEAIWMDESCTLSISGTGTISGVGSVSMTLSATGSTCADAAAQLRPQIIELQFRVHQ